MIQVSVCVFILSIRSDLTDAVCLCVQFLTFVIIYAVALKCLKPQFQFQECRGVLSYSLLQVAISQQADCTSSYQIIIHYQWPCEEESYVKKQMTINVPAVKAVPHTNLSFFTSSLWVNLCPHICVYSECEYLSQAGKTIER